MQIPRFFFAFSVGLAVLVFSFARRSTADDTIFPAALDVVVRGLNQARPIVATIQTNQKALTEKQIDAIRVLGLLKDGMSAGHIVRGIDLQAVKNRDPVSGPGERAPQWLSDSYPGASALVNIGPSGAYAVIVAAVDDETPTEIRSKLYAEVAVRCLEGDQELAVFFVERFRKHGTAGPADKPPLDKLIRDSRLDRLVREINAVKAPFAGSKSEELKTDRSAKENKSKSPAK